MQNYVVIADSSCDLPAEYLDTHEIKLVPYYVTVDGQNYKRESIDITSDEFYKALEERKVYPKTSLPPTSDYINVFTPPLEQGLDILCICLTSKFSGSYQSAHIAKDMLHEKYPNRKILIVDSILCTGGQGMLVQAATQLREQGKSIEETKGIIEEIKHRTRLIFTVDNLEYLQRGGRIGKVSAVAGSLLNIKPIIVMRNGELVPQAKIRGRKKAMDEVIEIATKETEGVREQYHFSLLHTNSLADLHSLGDALSHRWGALGTGLPICRIGVTIGTHIGPTVVGIACMPKI